MSAFREEEHESALMCRCFQSMVSLRVDCTSSGELDSFFWERTTQTERLLYATAVLYRARIAKTRKNLVFFLKLFLLLVISSYWYFYYWYFSYRYFYYWYFYYGYFYVPFTFKPPHVAAAATSGRSERSDWRLTTSEFSVTDASLRSSIPILWFQSPYLTRARKRAYASLPS